MITLPLQTLSGILNGTLIGKSDLLIESVSTDSRQAVQQGLFFALKGEKFDAHHYLEQAVLQGNVAVVVEKEMAVNVPQIVVSDTRLALGALAKWLKAKLNPKTVAITGSSGKTTVKEMCANILQKMTACKEAVLYTFGNLNNELGVPMTLLRLTEQHQFAVIELGANHLGEIAYTADIVQPDACLVNNVAPAHLAGFGSLMGVVQAKGEIYQGLKTGGKAIINLAHYHQQWLKAIGNNELQQFSPSGREYKGRQADYWADNISLNANGSTFTLHTPQGEIDIALPYVGEHNVSNALAATSLAMAVGADLAAVKAGLEQYSPVKGRLYPVQINPHLLLIDDTYNANVDSMKSAVSVLKNYNAFRLFALADMAELGEESLKCHKEVGEFAKKAGLDLIVSFGNESVEISGDKANHFTDKSEMIRYLLDVVLQKNAENQPVVLLVKGSRSQKMEEVVKAFCEHFNIGF